MHTFCPGLNDFSTCSTLSSEMREMCTYAPTEPHLFFELSPPLLFATLFSPDASAEAAAAATASSATLAAAAARRSRLPCPFSFLAAGALPVGAVPTFSMVDGTCVACIGYFGEQHNRREVS